MKFNNRVEAGDLLVENLLPWVSGIAVVVAIPRGGVIVGARIAQKLHLPLRVQVVRKLGVPGEPELAFGAVTSDGTCFLDRLFMRERGVKEREMGEILEAELTEAKRREASYGGYCPHISLSGKTVVLVDDGIATGATVVAALRSLMKQKPKKIIPAFPVCSANAISDVTINETPPLCLQADKKFRYVGFYYSHFPQVSDKEVIDVLKQCNETFQTA